MTHKATGHEQQQNPLNLGLLQFKEDPGVNGSLHIYLHLIHTCI